MREIDRLVRDSDSRNGRVKRGRRRLSFRPASRPKPTATASSTRSRRPKEAAARRAARAESRPAKGGEDRRGRPSDQKRGVFRAESGGQRQKQREGGA